MTKVYVCYRLNTNNLVEPVAPGLDLQLQEPFLLYRNSRCNIYGIWFYEKEECIRIANMLNKLLKECEENRKISNKPLLKAKKTSGPNVNNVDIFSMLSKAQEDFNTSRGSGRGGGGGCDSGSNTELKSPSVTPMVDNISGSLAAPLGPDVTSQSVMDFFAKAKVSIVFCLLYLSIISLSSMTLVYCVDQVNTGHFKAGDQPTPGSTAVVESKPLLARLMSHPAAHTLEHIEKQQRSVTPQPSHQSQSTTIPSTNKSKRRNKATPQQESVISTSAPISQDLPLPVTQNVNDSNGSTGFLRIQSPTNVVSSTLRNHQASNVTSTNNTNPLVSLLAHASGSTVRQFFKFIFYLLSVYTHVRARLFEDFYFFCLIVVIGRYYPGGTYVVRKRIGTSVNTTCDVCRSQST